MQVNLEELIKEFGIDKMPEDEQKVIMARLLQTVHTRVGLRMAETVSDEEADRIGELNEEGGEEALREIETIYPDFRKVYQEEVDKLREEMRSLMPPPDWRGDQQPQG